MQAYLPGLVFRDRLGRRGSFSSGALGKMRGAEELGGLAGEGDSWHRHWWCEGGEGAGIAPHTVGDPAAGWGVKESLSTSSGSPS